MRETVTYLIVGAGFTGATLAERIATVLGEEVLVVERRARVGGSAEDYRADDGLLIQKYGPHVFHTNSPKVWDYVQRFGEWRPIQYRVAASVGGELVPLPLGLSMLQSMVRLGHLSADGADSLAAALVQDYGLGARIGIRELTRAYPELGGWAIEHVYRGYNAKHWGMSIEELPPSVLARLPFVVGEQDSYFTDKYQAVPVNGYTALIERMLDHPKITVECGVDVQVINPEYKVIWTGSPDAFFNEAGALPYRSVEFSASVTRTTLPVEFATITHPRPDLTLTRATSMLKHAGRPNENQWDVQVCDFPCAYEPGKNDPFYPIPLEANVRRAQEYAARAPRNVHFAGRLGSYTYLNMDQAIAQALALFEKIKCSS